MNNRSITIWIVSLLVIGGFLGFITFKSDVVSGSTHYVGGSGPGNYTSIQAAIAAASPGDTIFVYDDSAPYYGRVNIYKTINLIGENRDTTIIDGGNSGDVIYVTANWVNVSGFTVVKSGPGWLNNAGIELDNVQNCKVFNNTASKNDRGIWLTSSSGNNITSNNLSNNDWGISLRDSSGNNITGNSASSNNYYDIELWNSSRNDIVGNSAPNSGYGIYLYSSPWNNLIGNTMVEGGIKIWGEQIEHWNTHNIGTSNTVNGKPVYYWKNQIGGVIPLGAGQVFLANCTNVRIENQELNYRSVGIQLGYSSNNNIISNSACYNNGDGISLFYSTGNNITGNNVSNNDSGIYLYYSSGNNITGNTASSNNNCGIHIRYSSENNITGNTASLNNDGGILLDYSGGNNITGNIAFSNDMYGIYLFHSSSSILIGNTVSSNNHYGISFSSTSNSSIISNTAYLNKFYGIYLSFSSDNKITGNTVSNTDYGIYLQGSSNNMITGTDVSSNARCGIYLSSSTNNNIVGNTVSNNFVGFTFRSPNNRIYYNDIIANTYQVYDFTNNNFWNGSYPSGGNYWSDYRGVDSFRGPNQDAPGGDGIGDNLYNIDEDSIDHYPLKNPRNTDSVPPSEPTNLIAKAGESYIEITWNTPFLDGSSPVKNYSIYKGETSGKETFLIEIGNVLFYNDTTVINGVTYYYKVSAVNSIGEGPLSNEASDTPKTSPTTPLQPSRELPGWLWITLLIIIAVIMIGFIVVLAIRRKRRKQQPPQQQEYPAKGQPQIDQPPQHPPLLETNELPPPSSPPPPPY